MRRVIPWEVSRLWQDDPVTTDSKDETPLARGNTPALARKMCNGDQKGDYMEINSYVTGLTDGEGCFCVSFNFRSKLNTNIEVRPSFSISLNQKDLPLLQKISKIFGCGAIRRSTRDRCYKYEVRNIDELSNVIIPHFKKFPLQGSKASDFEKFAKVCKMIKANLHRSKKFLPEIIEISCSINQGKRKYQKEDLLKHMARWRYSLIH